MEKQIESLTDLKLKAFLQKNINKLSKTLNVADIKAEILDQKIEEDVILAAKKIAQGELVVFQTETVYGLGANSFDEAAFLEIFNAKERPQTDPLIVHVSSQQQALSLVEITPEIQELFFYLSDKFWPGPLTIIMKQNSKISPKISANTGFVGIRMPKEKIALKLINLSGKPIAAPSANKFGHISPTSAIHVFNDLYDKKLTILEGGECQFGIESTVIKIIEDQQKNRIDLYILRNGSISVQQLQDHILNDKKYSKTVSIYEKIKESSAHITQNVEAPGQLLRHYSPYCETFLLDFRQDSINENLETIQFDLKECAFIDFKQQSLFFQDKCKAYFDLSIQGNLLEAMNKLYNLLRESELIDGIKTIFILNIDEYFKRQSPKYPEFFETVYDKLYRASEGKKLIFSDKQQKFLWQKK